MKKIMYLHGFASSGASGTVGLLRHELWEKAEGGGAWLLPEQVVKRDDGLDESGVGVAHEAARYDHR